MILEEELLTPTEVARLRRTTVAALAVERCARRDHPPFFRIGRKILYRKTDILEWLERHRIDPAAPEESNRPCDGRDGHDEGN